MRLETADRSYDSIDDYTISEAVQAVAELKTHFAVLTLDDNSFMKVAGGTAGLVLEYHDAQTGGHFLAADGELTGEDVTAAFESFANGDFAYRDGADWQPLKEASASGCAASP